MAERFASVSEDELCEKCTIKQLGVREMFMRRIYLGSLKIKFQINEKQIYAK